MKIRVECSPNAYVFDYPHLGKGDEAEAVYQALLDTNGELLQGGGECKSTGFRRDGSYLGEGNYTKFLEFKICIFPEEGGQKK